MHLASFTSRTSDRTLAAASLGPRHPAVRLTQVRDTAINRCLVAAASVLMMTALGIAGAPAARPLAIAASVLVVGFCVQTAVLNTALRRQVWDLIAAGRDDLPLADVRREVQRLQHPAYRERIARSFELLAQPLGAAARISCRASTLVVPGVVARVRHDTTAIASLLRDETAAVSGVAAAQRVLCVSDSPLFGRDPEVLRRELRRVEFLLRG